MSLNKKRNIKVLLLAAALSSAAFFTGCAGQVPLTDSVRFVIFGNTAPASPFSGFTASLDSVISAIESEKPAIVVHSGDAIYGGSESDGISEKDAKRQFRIFFSRMKNFHSVYYTLPGERDLFNGTTELYSEYSGRRPYYSFNYGSIHFITLNTSESGESLIDPKQMKWLTRDLEEFQDSSAIFVLMHRPFIISKKKSSSLPVPEEMHRLFVNSKVKAVFSGGDKSYSSAVHDSVRYISAGCSGFIDEKENRKSSQYYVVTLNGNDLEIKPVRVEIPKTVK